MANPQEHPTQADEWATQARIAGVIKLYMAHHDESQTMLAEAIGVGQTDVSKILSCKKKLTIDLLGRIAQHYDIGYETLLAGPEELLRSRCFSPKTLVTA